MNNSLKYTVLVGILAISTTSHAMEQKKPSLALRAATVIADHTPLNIAAAASLGALAYTASNALARRIGGGSWKTSLIHIGAQWAAGQLWDQINRRPLYAKNKQLGEQTPYTKSLIRRSGPVIQVASALLTRILLSQTWNAKSFILPTLATAATGALFIPDIDKNITPRLLFQMLPWIVIDKCEDKFANLGQKHRTFRFANRIDHLLIPGYDASLDEIIAKQMAEEAEEAEEAEQQPKTEGGQSGRCNRQRRRATDNEEGQQTTKKAMSCPDFIW